MAPTGGQTKSAVQMRCDLLHGRDKISKIPRRGDEARGARDMRSKHDGVTRHQGGGVVTISVVAEH